MNLKYKLTIECDIGNIDNSLESLLDDGYTELKAMNLLENWCRAHEIENIIDYVRRHFGDYKFNTEFEWTE